MTRVRIYGDDSPFGEWVRRHPELDSIHHGLTVNDIDWIFHKYRDNVDGFGVRTVSLMMDLETKTNGSTPNDYQKQTLFFRHQLLQRKAKLVDAITGNRIGVWHFGVFVLSMPATYPGEKFDFVTWYHFSPLGKLLPAELTVTQLVDILGFSVSPYDLEPLSLRRHHKTSQVLRTIRTALGFPTDEFITKRS